MAALAQKAAAVAAHRRAVAEASPRRRPLQTLRERFAKGAVGWSEDLERVLALPRRSKPDADTMRLIVDGLTTVLKKPEGTQRLREIQAWSLLEAPRAGGLVGCIVAGGGKTLLGMLMPMVWPPVQKPDGTFRPICALLLIPPDLRSQFASDWELYGKHWRLPNLAGGKMLTPGLPTLHVVAYSELSNPKSSALLNQIQPDLVMGDEISSLRNFDSSRTRRVIRRLAERPETAFCGWDATIISDGVANFWHLLAWALDFGSPMPLEESEVRNWARALDPTGEEGYFLPGELQRLCEAGEPLRTGFQRRLMATVGVLSTDDKRLGIPLQMFERRPPKMCDELIEHFRVLRRKPTNGGWKRPDGEELRDMLEVTACAKQLAEGFYLRWKFPRNESLEVRDTWFTWRQNWNREVRAVLSDSRLHMDSPKLCELAAQRYYEGGCTGCDRGAEEDHRPQCNEKETHPLWSSYCYPFWREVKNTVVHVTEAVWVSDWLLQDAAAWAAQVPGIVWVDHPEFGDRLSKMTGLPFYGGGEEANEEIATEYAEARGRSSRSIICSVKSNLRGKNLQYAFHRSLIISFPAANDIFEQMIGRVFREGQIADRVEVFYYQHTSELENAFEKARRVAKGVQELTGQVQKLNFAEWPKVAA
jgi:hypothetical protein